MRCVRFLAQGLSYTNGIILNTLYTVCRSCLSTSQIFLRILASYEAKIAKICNFWAFWPVIQLIYHLFKIRQKAFFVRF